MNRLQNATCRVQKKRVVCNYITIYRTHILFIEHIHHNVHTNVHPTHNHSQCTLHTHKHSHTILYYTRSPATSRPLNGHSAITIPIIRRWRSPSHTTCFLHCFSYPYCVPCLFSWAIPRASSKMHNLVIGRTSSVSFRRTHAERMRPSGPL